MSSGAWLAIICDIARGMAVATGSAISSQTGKVTRAQSARVPTNGVSGRSEMLVDVGQPEAGDSRSLTD